MNSSCLLVIAQHVADVLAQKALDALPEFLHAVDVLLLHAPRAVRRVGRARRELLDLLLHLVSSTTRPSRGRARAERRASARSSPASSRRAPSSRVMHISFGMPLISAEHDPHLPGFAVPAARRGRWPASPGSRARRRARPCLRRRPACTRRTRPCPFSPRQILNERVSCFAAASCAACAAVYASLGFASVDRRSSPSISSPR